MFWFLSSYAQHEIVDYVSSNVGIVDDTLREVS